ncbi:helix-turn-helix domain-containing protein [Dyadobacter sp. CY261]|uniref:helix-turn-helix domain-containing protein n=1 Tax=Dyadobacter sp. CY261 TaxID=2907203 RepID=UPI001F4250AA|nr:helix-turn-helix transcriptional regulator [Dyadobacter sp. CY261]MCF0074534.1 helix-turn-helix domain-containing protein [Dyadobacter sp. CY261]
MIPFFIMSTGFNEKIRAIRMMRGIKQSEIACLLNVKQQSISKIENGKVRIDKAVAEKIAQYFGFCNQFEMEAFYEKYISKKEVRENQLV